MSAEQKDPGDGLPPKGLMGWDGDVLVVDPSEPAFAHVPRKRLSPSTSNSMQDCAARWFVEKLVPGDGDPFAPMHVGSAAHAVMEDLYDRPFDQRTPVDAHSLLITVHERHPHLVVPDGSDPVALAKWRDKVILAMSGLWDIEDPATVMPGQREQQLDQVSIRGVPLSGFVDRVDPVVCEDGTIGQRIIDYKGLALDTPIPTPSGWTTMGELSVGDQVYGTAGEPVTVTIRSEIHNRPCYRLTFSDGTSVVCDNVHLWNVVDPHGRAETVDADELHAMHRDGVVIALPRAVTPQGRVVDVTVTSVEPVDSVPTRCIQVDAQDSLYLCGEGMVPTHNTGKWSTQSKLKLYGDDYAEQLRIYALALQELTGQLPARASLYYTAVGKSRDVPLGPRLLDQSAARFVDSWERHNEYVSTGRWPTRPSGLCNYCPLATVCPAAAASDRAVAPKTDTFLHGEAMLPVLADEPRPVPVDDPGPAPAHADGPPPLDEPVLPDDDPPGGATGPAPQDPPPPDEPALPVDDHQAPPELPARHTEQGHEPRDEEHDMAGSNGPWSVIEDKSWEETSQGDLNPNSFAAIAAFGISSMAVEELHRAGQPITGTTVSALALTLSGAVLDVQNDLTGSANFQRGLNTRLRGALRTAVDTYPIPFGADEDTWDEWYGNVRRRIRSIAVVAHRVWDTGVVDRPYSDLVGATQVRQTMTASTPN